MIAATTRQDAGSGAADREGCAAREGEAAEHSEHAAGHVCFGHQEGGPHQHESQSDFHHLVLLPMVRLREWRRAVWRVSVASVAMEDPLQVARDVAIPLAEVELRTSRSSGPGGQHANVTASRVEATSSTSRRRAASTTSTSGASRRGSGRSSGRSLRTRAARRATASWPSSGCARGWPRRSSVQRPRRADEADRRRAAQAAGCQAAARRAQAGAAGGRSPDVPRARSAPPRRPPRRPGAGCSAAGWPGPCRRRCPGWAASA